MYLNINKYNEDGYFRFDSLIELKQKYNLNFFVIIGGRGTGKTFGALEYCFGLFKEKGERTLYMRRTDVEINNSCSQTYNIFEPINIEQGVNIKPFPEKKNYNFYEANSDGKPEGEIICQAVALSNISSKRGFDASHINNLIFDEFIPETNARKVRGEGTAFKNAYETINRNRALKGQEEVTAYLFGNANSLDSEILIEMGFLKDIEEMAKRKKDCYVNPERGFCIMLLTDSPISDKKKTTALYRLLGDDEFTAMSLENFFTDTADEMIQSKSIKGARAIFQIGGVCLYKLSNGSFYVSEHISGSPVKISADRARAHYHWVVIQLLYGQVYFESFLCKKILTDVFK